MSKQATLTSFFHARKATADGADLHAIKKRKVELQDDLGKNVSQNAMACSFMDWLHLLFFFHIRVKSGPR